MSEARGDLEALQQGEGLSAQALGELAHALHYALEGARLQKLRDPERGCLALKLRVPSQSYYLSLRATAEGASLRLGLERPPTLPNPTGLGRWARAHLEGTKLCAVRQIDGDRIIAFDFLGRPPREGERQRGGSLYLELIPSLYNLYAVDLDGRVRAWLGRIQARTLHLGRPWEPPVRPEGFEVAEQPPRAPLSAEEARALLEPLMAEEQARVVASGEDRASRSLRERRRLIKQTRARLKRLVSALWGDIERAERAEEWGRHAELLKSQLGRLKRGMSSIKVTDWFDPELKEIEVPLDPTRDGKENMERLFQRQRKALRGAEIATERLINAEIQLERFEELITAHEGASLEELSAALRAEGLFREKQLSSRVSKQSPRKPYRVFWSARGEQLWVGRGGQDNHATSFQHARGQDLWIHTRDVPGAHVIIPLPRRGHEPHLETIRDAAALAVHHSPQRGEQGVELYFTERKHIRPVPGGAPGKVMVASSKTLTALEVEERIERLYAERLRRGSPD